MKIAETVTQPLPTLPEAAPKNTLVPLSKRMDQYFAALRFDPRTHLGLGDIRLTLGEQDAIVDLICKWENLTV